jgi:hypothetical protein
MTRAAQLENVYLSKKSNSLTMLMSPHGMNRHGKDQYFQQLKPQVMLMATLT